MSRSPAAQSPTLLPKETENPGVQAPSCPTTPPGTPAIRAPNPAFLQPTNQPHSQAPTQTTSSSIGWGYWGRFVTTGRIPWTRHNTGGEEQSFIVESLVQQRGALLSPSPTQINNNLPPPSLPPFLPPATSLGLESRENPGTRAPSPPLL